MAGIESDLISWLRARITSRPPVVVGLGDDAAVLDLSGVAGCVVTTDLLMDGIDFRLAECDPRRVGRKALAVNLSDLAAMAARPLAGFVSLALPRSGGTELAKLLYEGLLPLASEFGLPIAGGDTNSWDGPLVINVLVLGDATERGPLLRSGARPGDEILVTGQFGGSIQGHHFDFTPRVREASRLHAEYELHAGVDVSDGLLRDLHHLVEESGCGAVVDCSQVPIREAAFQLAQADPRRSALERALSDGEDFELILAVPPAEAQRMLHEQPLDVSITRIGQFIEQPGLWQQQPDGTRTPLEPRGYEH